MSLLSKSHDKLCVTVEEFLRGSSLAWLIESFVQKASFALMYGEPGVGKTFYALDIACAVARGTDWRGKTTVKGAVAYIAAEDSMGVRSRLDAYCRVNQINPADLDLHMTTAGVSLLDGKWVDSYIEVLKKIPNLTLVVIDTLAASTPGADENNSASMGMFIYLCKRIQMETNATVLVVHHCGKDISRGARGWSGLRGAADTVIFLRKLSGHYIAAVEKQKNSCDGTESPFQLEEVNFPDGNNPCHSCVVLHVDNILSPVADAGEVQRRIMDSVRKLCAEGADITQEVVIRRLLDMEPPSRVGGRDRRVEKFTRSLKSLLDKGILVQREGLIIENEVSS